jgi:nitrate reductase gamma subunit
MQTALKYGVILAAAVASASCVFKAVRTRSFAKKTSFSQASGRTWKGILYAFSRGLAPWEKESAKKHLPTYFAGILYHAGIFVAFFVLLLRMISAELLFTAAVRIILAGGLAAGLGLLIKRLSQTYLRHISSADDYISNLLADLFLLSALLSTWLAAALPWFHIAAIVLLVYLPWGKIIHCVFFFYSRTVFGRFFGRRGVYPHHRGTDPAK